MLNADWCNRYMTVLWWSEFIGVTEVFVCCRPNRKSSYAHHLGTEINTINIHHFSLENSKFTHIILLLYIFARYFFPADLQQGQLRELRTSTKPVNKFRMLAITRGKLKDDIKLKWEPRKQDNDLVGEIMKYASVSIAFVQYIVYYLVVD